MKSVEDKDFLFSIGTDRDCWLVDSSATRHAVNYKEFFTSIDESYHGEIKVASGEILKAHGIGSGTFTFTGECGTAQTVIAAEFCMHQN